MATYPAEAITAAGVVLTPRTAASGDKLTYDAGAVLRVINAAGSPVTVTITVAGNNSYGQANPDPVISITNATTKAILMLPAYVDATESAIILTWSSTTDVTFTYERH